MIFGFIQIFKLFMSNILLCHGYARKYVIMNGIKKLKKLIVRSPRSGIWRVKSTRTAAHASYRAGCRMDMPFFTVWIKSDF
jgi:hypothetical protein